MASTARPPLVGADERTAFRGLDWPLVLSAGLLMLFGLMALYSVGHRTGENTFKKQLLMALIGLIPFGLFFFVDPKSWTKAAKALYVVNLIVLASVLFFGASTNGAQRWIDLKFMQFQPSEMAKLLTVLTLATFLASRKDSIKSKSTFILSFVHVVIPAALIAQQPHYGGATVLIVVWLCMCLAGNVPIGFILAALVLLSGVAVGATQIPGLLHGYHLKRLQAMQQEDKQGASYQQDRAQIALGVGGILGAGWLKGRQTLPEQQNDFIFTVLGEELGLVGSVLVLGAFGFFLYRLWLVMLGATEPYHRMLVAGVLAIFAFHTIVNLAMVLQLIPVVGLWLPFMSAGGTALWLCMAALGLVLKVRSRERPILF